MHKQAHRSAIVSKQAEGPRDQWVSLPTAMSALDKSRSFVLTMIMRGELAAEHIANRTVVRRDSLDALIAARAVA